VRFYVAVIQTLLEALALAANTEVLVDSSKLPPGFLTEALVGRMALDVVQIVRDPRAVANSERKTLKILQAGEDALVPGRSILKSTMYWSVANLAVQRLARRAATFSMIRYEDLAAFPEREIRALAERLDLEGPVPGQPLVSAGHVAVGNPTRFDDPGRSIRPDTAWKTELPVAQRLLVTGLSAPARVLLDRSDHRRPVRR
jgi:hypothetical protein